MKAFKYFKATNKHPLEEAGICFCPFFSLFRCALEVQVAAVEVLLRSDEDRRERVDLDAIERLLSENLSDDMTEAGNCSSEFGGWFAVVFVVLCLTYTYLYNHCGFAKRPEFDIYSIGFVMFVVCVFFGVF